MSLKSQHADDQTCQLTRNNETKHGLIYLFLYRTHIQI